MGFDDILKKWTQKRGNDIMEKRSVDNEKIPQLQRRI